MKATESRSTKLSTVMKNCPTPTRLISSVSVFKKNIRKFVYAEGVTQLASVTIANFTSFFRKDCFPFLFGCLFNLFRSSEHIIPLELFFFSNI